MVPEHHSGWCRCLQDVLTDQYLMYSKRMFINLISAYMGPSATIMTYHLPSYKKALPHSMSSSVPKKEKTAVGRPGSLSTTLLPILSNLLMSDNFPKGGETASRQRGVKHSRDINLSDTACTTPKELEDMTIGRYCAAAGNVEAYRRWVSWRWPMGRNTQLEATEPSQRARRGPLYPGR